MRAKIHPGDIPSASEIAACLAGAYFSDAFVLRVAAVDRPALAYYLQAVRRTPRWVDFLMAMRNRVARIAGLKDLGAMTDLDAGKQASDYRVGERIGIFSILYLSEQEVILGDADKHLDVKVSVCKIGSGAELSITVSTVVHVHNLLGRLYLLPVIPLHKLIVPAVIARIA